MARADTEGSSGQHDEVGIVNSAMERANLSNGEEGNEEEGAEEVEEKADDNKSKEEKESEKDDDDEEIDDDEDDFYIVERIVDHKDMKSKGFKYLIKWEGYSAAESTWEDEDNILDKAILKKYWDEQSTKEDALRHAKDNALKKKTPRKTPAKSKAKTPASKTTTPRHNTRTSGTVASSNGNNKRRRTLDAEEEPKNNDPMMGVPFGSDGPEVPNWEPLVNAIETIDRKDDGTLMVYIEWKNGIRGEYPSDLVYKHCPQTMLQFYEGRLRFRTK